MSICHFLDKLSRIFLEEEDVVSIITHFVRLIKRKTAMDTAILIHAVSVATQWQLLTASYFLCFCGNIKRYSGLQRSIPDEADLCLDRHQETPKPCLGKAIGETGAPWAVIITINWLAGAGGALVNSTNLRALDSGWFEYALGWWIGGRNYSVPHRLLPSSPSSSISSLWL